MQYKVAICDDDEKQRDYVTEIVTKWAEKNHHLLEIHKYPDGNAFLFDYEQEKDFDILLLDVEMPKMTGIELAKEVRKNNQTVQMVFITWYYEYFGEGFDVAALHYLIKPVNYEKLYPVLDKAVSNLFYRQRSVLLATSDADIKVLLSDIMYVESDNVHVVVHTPQDEYRVRMTLGKFSKELDDAFYKVHRSYIVNLKFVKKIMRTEITMMNGDLIPISRGMYDEVHTALIKHL